MEMVQTTIVEKIQVIFSMLFSSPATFLLAVGIGILVSIFYYLIRYANHNKNIFVAIYGVVCVLLGILYFDPLIKGIDVIVNGLLTTFYFPTISFYLLLVLAVNGILIYTIFSKKLDLTIRKVNLVMFGIIELLFIDFLALSQKQGVILTNANQIYMEKQLLVILEATNELILVWGIIILGVIVIRKMLKGERPLSASEQDMSYYDAPMPVEVPLWVPGTDMFSFSPVDDAPPIASYKKVKIEKSALLEQYATPIQVETAVPVEKEQKISKPVEIKTEVVTYPQETEKNKFIPQSKTVSPEIEQSKIAEKMENENKKNHIDEMKKIVLEENQSLQQQFHLLEMTQTIANSRAATKINYLISIAPSYQMKQDLRDLLRQLQLHSGDLQSQAEDLKKVQNHETNRLTELLKEVEKREQN